MAEGTVDSLNIHLSADANRAVKSLNSLTSTLNRVNKAFNGLNTKNIGAFSNNVNKLANSLKALNGIKISAPNISGLSKELSAISKIDFSKINSASQPLRELGNAVQTLSGLQNISIPKLDSKNINSIINFVEKLNSLDTKTIPNVSNSISKTVEAFSSLSSVNIKDNGINKTINALNRLFSIDLSNFNAEQFGKITGLISTLGNMPDVSSSINRFISSISRLANAGSKTGQTASSILLLAKETKKAARELSGVGNISDDINMFVQSIGRLASAGGKTGQTASGMKSLAKETLAFFNTMKNAPRISQNTIAMTQALAQLANAGGKVGTATNTVSSAFDRLSNISSRAGNAVKNAASKIVSAFKNIGSSSKHVSTASLNLKNLLGGALLFSGIRGLTNFTKSAINLGSAITEVENVVDVSFGNMASKAYEFAETATEQFGLSELQAKQYAGTMMAVLNSSGVAQESAAEMSTTLAGLAGDLASFYNITQENAWEKIMSGMAGEIEPLRRLGINLSVANLQAYALSQGITKSWQSMTQAEQVMLRYNYLLQLTSAQQGDFARTSGTWANQVRLLTVNFQSLAATIGQGLIAAILPALQALNALMAMLQKAALAFRNFIYTLTGYKGKGSQGGIVNEFAGIGDVSSGLGDIGSAGSDAADGLDDAAGSAEKLKKELSVLPFDELNQLQESASASGGSGGVGGVGGGGGGLGGLGDIGDFGGDDLINALGESKLPDAINKWAQRIRDAFLDHDWERLGKEIAWGINKGFEYIYDAINWKNVGPKITRFTNAFTRTFNSLVNNIDWDLIGRTFGAGINTIVNTLNQLADGINWLNLGRKLSEGINGLFDEIEWENLGHLIGNKFRIAWEIFGGFVTGLDYASIGKDVSDGLNGVFSTISFTDIANFLASALNGAFEFLGNFTKNFNWQGLVDNITNGINEFISKFKWKENGASLNAFLQDLLDSIIEISENVNWNELGEGIGNFLSEIDWGSILSGIVTVIKNSFVGLIEGLDAGGTAGSILSWITKAFILVKVTGPVLGLVGKISTALTGNSPLTLLSNAFKKLFSKSSSSAVGEIGKIGTAAETASKGGISSLLSSVGRLAPVFGIATGAAYMGTSAVRELNKESVETAESTQKLSDNLMDMKKSGEISAEQWEKLYTVITDGQAAGKDASEIFSDVANKMDEMGISSESAEKAIEEAGGSIDNFSKKAKDAQDEINSIDMISLVDQLNSTSDAIETVEFSKMTIEAAEAVDAVGGIWEKGMDGWKQITGSKAIEIYQGIMSGIYSDNGQGYYDIGNGILVSLGQGISGGTEGFKSTLDMSLIQTLQNKLPEGYSIAYENGKVTIDNYRKGIEQNGDLLSLGLTNATIDKINSILPQGMMIAYDNGHMTIQNYASGISGEGNAESVNVALNNATIKQIESVLPEGVTISYNNGSKVIEGFKSGLSEDKSSIITVLRNTFVDNIDFGEELKEKFSGYAALSQKGYTERINSLKKDTEDTMRGFANNAVKSPFAKELGINSPSKVFEGFGDNIAQGLANGIENNSDEPKRKLETLGNTLKKNMDSTLEGMERNTSFSIERLGRSFDSAKRSADNARENIISAFTGIHIPLPHISINWNPIKVGSLSFSIPSFGLNWYAAGGLFSKASIIGVGENGDEAVLPLENKRTMGMIADSIMESGNIGVDEETLANAVAQGVAMAMMNNQGNQTPINLYATLYTEDNEVLARAVAKGQESIDYRYNPTPQFG